MSQHDPLGAFDERRIEPDDMQVVSEPEAEGEAQAERKLPQQLAELRVLQSVIDNMGDALLVVDSSGEIVLSNPAARRIFGADFEDMDVELWRTRFEMFRADRTTPYPDEERPLMRALRGEKVDLEDVYIRVDSGLNAWFSVTARPLLDEEGVVQGAFGMFRDVTRRKRTEETLRLRDRAMASAREGITITDARKPGNPIIYSNAGFERLTGYQKDEILGNVWRFLQGPRTSQETLRTLRSAIEEQRPCTAELINYRKDGTPFWNRVSITPVYDYFGRLTHYVGIHSDITAIKQTEDRLRAARDELQAAYRRMKRNLEAAANVQKSLLPTNLPRFDWGAIAWRFEPCDELAGDILNVFPLDDEHVGAYVLDVSGHGVVAALLSVTVRRFLSPSYSPSSFVSRRRTQAPGRRIVPPAEVADRLNRRFAWDANRGQFFTMFYGVLNTKTGHFRYVSAGHPPPLHLTHGGRKIAALPGKGFPIGVGKESYQESTVQMAPGDRIVIYSDGVTDVMNRRRELFGEWRLRQVLEEYSSRTLDESLGAVLRRIKEWSDGARLKDDVSLLGVELSPKFRSRGAAGRASGESEQSDVGEISGVE